MKENRKTKVSPLPQQKSRWDRQLTNANVEPESVNKDQGQTEGKRPNEVYAERQKRKRQISARLAAVMEVIGWDAPTFARYLEGRGVLETETENKTNERKVRSWINAGTKGRVFSKMLDAIPTIPVIHDFGWPIGWHTQYILNGEISPTISGEARGRLEKALNPAPHVSPNNAPDRLPPNQIEAGPTRRDYNAGILHESWKNEMRFVLLNKRSVREFLAPPGWLKTQLMLDVMSDVDPRRESIVYVNPVALQSFEEFWIAVHKDLRAKKLSCSDNGSFDSVDEAIKNSKAKQPPVALVVDDLDRFAHALLSKTKATPEEYLKWRRDLIKLGCAVAVAGTYAAVDIAVLNGGDSLVKFELANSSPCEAWTTWLKRLGREHKIASTVLDAISNEAQTCPKAFLRGIEALDMGQSLSKALTWVQACHERNAETILEEAPRRVRDYLINLAIGKTERDPRIERFLKRARILKTDSPSSELTVTAWGAFFEEQQLS